MAVHKGVKLFFAAVLLAVVVGNIGRFISGYFPAVRIGFYAVVSAGVGLVLVSPLLLYIERNKLSEGETLFSWFRSRL